jgi:PAS domain S-box-containing protein
MLQSTVPSSAANYFIFDQLIEGVQVIDFQYLYFYLNDSVLAQAKSTKEALLGFSMIEKFPGIEQSPMFAFLQKCMELREAQTYLNEFQHLDGSKGYFELRMQPVPEGVLILSIDETAKTVAIKELEEQIVRYRCVADASSDAIWDWDLITDRATFGEGNWTIFGFEEKEIEHFSNFIMEKIHPDDVPVIQYKIKCITEVDEKKWEFEYRIKTAAGNYVNVLDRGTALKNELGQTIRIIGARRDITLQKRIEHQKKILSEIIPVFSESIEFKSALEKILGQLVGYFDDYKLAELWLVEPTQKSIDLICKASEFSFANQFYKETKQWNTFGFGEGMPGTVWKTKKRQIWNDVQSNVAFARRNAAQLIDLKTVKGIPLLCKDEVIGVLLLGASVDLKADIYNDQFYNDLSKLLGSEINRKQIEQELTEIFNAAPDIICVAGLDGYYKKINPRMCDLLGYSENQLLNDPIVTYIHPDDKERTITETVRISSEVNSHNFENRYVAKDGSIIWLSWSSILNTDTGLIYAVARDITEIKATEIQLKLLNKELAERALKLQQSNEELEQFAFIASHDLQEPLRMVTSFVSLLEKKYSHLMDESGQQYIHFAVDGARRMRQIILDLLEYSRIGKTRIEMHDVDLLKCVNYIERDQRARIEELNAQISTENLTVIRSYETPVYQLLQNLISNSLKYHAVGKRPEIHIKMTETDKDWIISVSDNGIGIKPEFHDKIFLLFQRLHTKDKYNGTGIGLSLCKKIVTDLKGAIWLESEKGVGSTFYFSLPKEAQ